MKIAKVNEKWLGRPLCRGYRIVVVAESFASVRVADETRDLRLGWALGFLPNTEAEIFGLWVQTDTPPDAIREIRDRGVERIALVIDAGWTPAAREALSTYPRTREVASSERFIRQVTAPLGSKHRAAAAADLRAAFSAESEGTLLDAILAVRSLQRRKVVDQPSSHLHEAQRVQRSLLAQSQHDRRFAMAADRTATVLLEEVARAVQRNGYFLNQDAAIEFVAKTLLGAERRMDRERAAIAAQVQLLRGVSEGCPAGSGAA